MRDQFSSRNTDETMTLMIVLSLLLNIAILIPVCAGLLRNAAWAHESYGEPTPGRGILLSIYLSILAASAILLIYTRPEAVAALLLVQIVYKVTTPFTVRTLKNPVVVSNLLIAGFHTVTLILILRHWNP